MWRIFSSLTAGIGHADVFALPNNGPSAPFNKPSVTTRQRRKTIVSRAESGKLADEMPAERVVTAVEINDHCQYALRFASSFCDSHGACSQLRLPFCSLLPVIIGACWPALAGKAEPVIDRISVWTEPNASWWSTLPMKW